MKLSSAEGAKLLKKLKSEFDALKSKESISSTFLASDGENPESVRPKYDYSDDVRDLITNNSGTKTGYFIMVDKPEKALTDFIGSAFHSLNREYVVFNSEKEYLKYRNRIPKEIGLICSDNLYGFGIITQIMRQSGLKNS